MQFDKKSINLTNTLKGVRQFDGCGLPGVPLIHGQQVPI